MTAAALADDVVRVRALQWRHLLTWSPDDALSERHIVLGQRLADLMRHDGTLEAYEDEIGAHLNCAGRTVRRLLQALVRARMLCRAHRSSPAGPAVFVARHPLTLPASEVAGEHRPPASACSPDTPCPVAGEHRPPQCRCSPATSIGVSAERADGAWPVNTGHSVAGVMPSDLRKRRKSRARARGTYGVTYRQETQGSTQGETPAQLPPEDSRAVDVAAATGADSATPRDLARPPTSAPARERDASSDKIHKRAGRDRERGRGRRRR